VSRLEQVRAEFTRQAGAMEASAVFSASDVLDRIVRALGAPPPGRVLDLACGPGLVAEALAPVVGEIVGVDATPEMVARARARLAAAGTSRAAFHVAAAEALPFDAEAFDAVVTRLSFHHFPDLRAVLAETRRVLRPGGRLVVVDLVASADPAERALRDALERLRDPTHVRVLPLEELASELVAAGFERIAEESWPQPRTFPDWSAVVADPVRTAPLEEVMRALARAGVRAGIELHESAGELRFTYTWALVAARRNP
jgi:ubiquinone/menaquinone biosynthesis C-methylase UbiE